MPPTWQAIDPVKTYPDRIEIYSVVFRFRDGNVANVRLYGEDQD